MSSDQKQKQSCCAPIRDGGPVSDAPVRVPCAATEGLNGGATKDYVSLPGDEFRMGTDDRRFPADGEGPIRDVAVDGFDISAVPVTNAEFDAFVSPRRGM